ncbi:hypothetical protein ACIPVB_15435 [Microbacterium sp. NPDC090007]|uniref:hypothetical protein n=1 Tax=Microbacterium sp. NPDC090007 TaxID=3364204 RepID=UPI00382A53C1
MAREDARDLLSNILDRCAATDAPFWEVSAQERAQVARRFGSPGVVTRLGRDSDEKQRTAAADLFLATALLAEIAVEFAQQSRTHAHRSEAVVAIQKRVNDLLGHGDAGDPAAVMGAD